MISMIDCQERVDRGADWLDEHTPYWWKIVELRTFDIRFGCRCVLGQVFDADFRHETALNGGVPAQDDPYNYVCRILFEPQGLVDEDLGFDVSRWTEDSTKEYEILQSLWETKIKERRVSHGEIED